jgi:hypothetical protein
MPYITRDRRIELGMREDVPRNAGELNYTFTWAALEYIRENGESYQTYNDIIGALEGAKLELYRRRVASYEDGKKAVNGDVF